MSVKPVILCGGSGTRLWPLSTPDQPKQFLPLTSDQPMITETAKRFEQSFVEGLAFDRVSVVGSEKHAALLSEALPGAELILEPFGRNSAPAVAAISLISKPDDLLLILPADHSIKKVDVFHSVIAKGVAPALNGNIVTFSLEPTFPATGYGYIHAEELNGPVRDVKAFVEKPTKDVAETYLAKGDYFWNAGIFLFKASTMLAALEEHAPDIIPAVQAALLEREALTTRLAPDAFAKVPNISIDYAVMEHADNVKTIPVDMGWSDVGDYLALHELFSPDQGGVVTKGQVHIVDSENLYANSQGPVITASGVSDLVIVATEDTMMITKMGHPDSVKALGAHVSKHRNKLGLDPTLISETKSWLWSAFDLWVDLAWDEEADGFVEQTSLDGVPDVESPRRIRVQARQVYSFAKALQLGWTSSKAESLVKQGLAYLDEKLRHPDGGWGHIANRNGELTDTRRDLYDHAFIILAGTAAYETTKSDIALKIANDALDFINDRLIDDKNGGWFEGLPSALPRRANPHMHLLEAGCALYKATGSKAALQVARECVRLFECHFFDPNTNIVVEFFTSDWSPQEPNSAAVYEAGHMFEWASLLKDYDRLTGHDSLSWRRRLIRTANTIGLNSDSGFAYNSQTLDGSSNNLKQRLWPQLEMLRAYLLHPGIASRDQVETVMKNIQARYVEPMPKGLWMDEFDENGRPYSQAVPASMLYHFLTAYGLFLT